MEKKEVQRMMRDKMKALGFQAKGNSYYKIVDNDYLIGVYLDHHPFCKGYFFEAGAVYLPDEGKMPFDGCFDYDERFVFTKTPEEDLNSYDLEGWDDSTSDELLDYFEYGQRSKEELDKQLDINIQRRLNKFYDKEYIFNQFRDDLMLLVDLPEATVNKIVQRGNFDEEKIYELRKELGY